ncbi:hypothetical protein I315_03597 [Cryptococcus gattii Ru294]|nr:hypothetical protein I315_03597 [Cryptococcus gattii Ru294]
MLASLTERASCFPISLMMTASRALVRFSTVCRLLRWSFRTPRPSSRTTESTHLTQESMASAHWPIRSPSGVTAWEVSPTWMPTLLQGLEVLRPSRALSAFTRKMLVYFISTPISAT